MFNRQIIFLGSGVIEFQEFVTAFKEERTIPAADELRMVFKGMDTNGDGTLSMEEIRKGLKEAGQPMSDEALRDLFNTIDADKSGTITFEGNTFSYTVQKKNEEIVNEKLGFFLFTLNTTNDVKMTQNFLRRSKILITKVYLLQTFIVDLKLFAGK